MTTTFGSAPATVEPQIWVGCLACYNAGRLVGEWIDPAEVDEATTDEVRKMIHGSVRQRDCEEVWVMDHEGFGGLLKGECSPWEALQVYRFIEQIEDAGLPVAAFAEWRSNAYADDELDDDLLTVFREAYRGEWESAESWAWSFLEDTGQLATLPEWVESYRGAVVKAWLADEIAGGGTWTADAANGHVYVFGS